MLKNATIDNVLAERFDKVILATGSHPIIPPIPGVKDNPNVLLAPDVMKGKEKFGKDVVVIGGGLVGCECAAYCAETADRVTIIEMCDDILTTVVHAANNDMALRCMLAERKIEMICGATVSEIKEHEVNYTKDGVIKTLKADTVIISAGMEPNNELFKTLSENIDVDIIGDASSPGKIIDAVHQGFHIANNI